MSACTTSGFWEVEVVVSPEIQSESEGEFLLIRVVGDDWSDVRVLTEIEPGASEDLTVPDEVGMGECCFQGHQFADFLAWIDADPEATQPGSDHFQSGQQQVRGASSIDHGDPFASRGTRVELVLERP